MVWAGRHWVGHGRVALRGTGERDDGRGGGPWFGRLAFPTVAYATLAHLYPFPIHPFPAHREPLPASAARPTAARRSLW